MNAPAAEGRLAIWCGWVMLALALAIPPFAWLAPKGLAALLALAGLATLPAIRISDDDRPGLIVLFGALIWAAATTTWSPYHPKNAASSSILKLACALPLFYSAVCGARRADPRLKRRALGLLAWGAAAVGVILMAEAASGAAIYRWIHVALYKQPIRTDLGQVNVAQSTFVMAVLWPLATLGAPIRLRPWLALVTVVGVAWAAIAFSADAPVIAVVLAPAVFLAAWRWPTGAPRVMAAVAATLFLTTPAIVWLVRRNADYVGLQQALPLSWAQRLGYWSHAIDWIGDQPLRGWGLDASKMFAPAIQLHPHSGSLQVWLELGVVGAVAAAAFWGVTLLRLARPVRDPVVAAAAGSAAVYLLFGAVNFGLWQEWWLATGVLIPTLAALRQPSTSATFSE